MNEDTAIVTITLCLIALLAVVIIFNRGESTQTIVADLAKVSISGYLGYIAGGERR